MKLTAAILAAAAVLAAVPALAQAPTILRGTITDVQANQITVRPKTGKPVTVALTPDWRVAVTKRISAADIKPGSFIGSAEMPQATGVGRSLEVHVFPPGVKIGEGHYAWDKRKGSMMTNGTVGKINLARNRRELEVDYGTGRRKVVVSPSIPIVQITDGRRDQLKRGIPVFLIAGKGPQGALVTNAVTIGEKGAAPPM